MSGSAFGYAVAAAICLALASALQHHTATAEQGYCCRIHLLSRPAPHPPMERGPARGGRVTGFALGLADGTLYGLVGGVLKATVQAALRDPAAAVTGWPLWALAVLGAWAFIIHQRAYTHAPLGVSLPALSVANPLAGMVFGTLVFRETPAHGPLAPLGEARGLAVIIVSVMMLARPAASAGRHRLSPAAGASDHRHLGTAEPGRRTRPSSIDRP